MSLRRPNLNNDKNIFDKKAGCFYDAILYIQYIPYNNGSPGKPHLRCAPPEFYLSDYSAQHNILKINII